MGKQFYTALGNAFRGTENLLAGGTQILTKPMVSQENALDDVNNFIDSNVMLMFEAKKTIDYMAKEKKGKRFFDSVKQPRAFRAINLLLFAIVFLNSLCAMAQDDLMAELNKDLSKERDVIHSTFKGTRLVNLHTVETLGKGTLEFRIAHRFGDFSSGSTNFWGLDGPATIQFHFDYGVTDRLTLGIGRASYNKVYDAFAKYNLVRQTSDNSQPATVTLLGSVNMASYVDPTASVTGVDRYQEFGNRLAYVAQVMIARKFNSKLSLQLSPIFIHYNLANNLGDKNDMFAVGLSGRHKITSHAAVTAEYIYRVNKYSTNFNSYNDALSVGFDLETGGHVFQVFVTNAVAINEATVIPYSETKWLKGQIRLGFNVSRVFGGHKVAK